LDLLIQAKQDVLAPFVEIHDTRRQTVGVEAETKLNEELIAFVRP